MKKEDQKQQHFFYHFGADLLWDQDITINDQNYLNSFKGVKFEFNPELYLRSVRNFERYLSVTVISPVEYISEGVIRSIVHQKRDPFRYKKEWVGIITIDNYGFLNFDTGELGIRVING